MKEFKILLVGDFLSEKEISIALNSFQELYHSVTFKHQRRLKLTIIESEQNFPELIKMLKSKKIQTACQIVSPVDQSMVQSILKDSSIMFLPTFSNIGKLIPVAFENGLPIVSLSTEDNLEKLDNTCSQLISVSYKSEIETMFSETLKMLYFDPAACSILRKGSLTKFHADYNWGRQKVMAK